MKDSAHEDVGLPQLATPSQSHTISERKLRANRENDRKSTGPKTRRGMAYSRMNAVKHGIFVRERDRMMLGEEDPRDFHEFYHRLLDEWKPVGTSEEFEVERIAVCWLKLQRLWRYENAQILASHMSVDDLVERGFYEPVAHSTKRSTFMSLLQAAEKEAEAKGQVSHELMQKLFAHDGMLRMMWQGFEKKAERMAQKKQLDIAITIAEQRQLPLSDAKALLVRNAKSVPERQRFVAAETVREARRTIYGEWWNVSRWKIRNERECRLIPDDPAIDKIIRYGNAIDKQLERAQDRLERLQRRRKGEPVPPPLNVHLTQ